MPKILPDDRTIADNLRDIANGAETEWQEQVCRAGADEIDHLEGLLQKVEAWQQKAADLGWAYTEALNIGHGEHEAKLALLDHLLSLPHSKCPTSSPQS